MTNQIKPFGSIELAVRELLLANVTDATPEQVDGDFAYDPATMPFFIRIDKVPGTSTDRFGGDFAIDVEVFGVNYLEVESQALDIEALLLGYPHVVRVGDLTWVFDEVTQNSSPNELPWEDDEVTRLGATYVITARRR
jgi:hypothetical protein